MSDIKIPVEIRKKYIANIESTSQVHERKLAKEIISYKGLTDVNAKILEKNE